MDTWLVILKSRNFGLYINSEMMINIVDMKKNDEVSSLSICYSLVE